MNKIWIIAEREFMTRVKKKTFLLSTLLLPLLIFGFYGLMIYFSVSSDSYKVAVIDNANIFEGSIDDKKSDISFEFVKADTNSIKSRVTKSEFDGYLFVPANFNLMGTDSLIFRSSKTIGLITRSDLEKKVNNVLEQKRFSQMNIAKETLDSLKRKSNITYQALFGSSNGDNKAGISYAIGYISGFLIYIVLFIYGTMVMRGVMEEKVSRIAEVIVSSAKPFQLMMGKIVGIGAVGLLQFLIWIVLMTVLASIMPSVMNQAAVTPGPAGGGMQAMQAAQDSGLMGGLSKALAQANLPLLLSCFIFYFLGGYLLYSSLFAAVGSAVNEDPQDAQSLLLPITMPIIFAIVIMTKAVNAPNSGLAVFGSLFPLTSPVVMMARIAHGVPEGVPMWQLILSGVLLILGFLGTTWMAAKIYRTGILLYGKKVTWKEMWKWAFRKN